MKRSNVVVLSVCTVVVAAAVPALASGLVGYYTFDNSDAADASPFGNDGTTGGSFVSDVPSAIGSGLALQMTGPAAERVLVPNSPSLETISDELTIGFWVKAATGDNDNWVRFARKATGGSGAQGWILSRYNNTDNINIRTDTQGAGGAFNQNRPSGGDAARSILDGEWHYLTFTLDNGDVAEYIDGAEVWSGTYPHGNGFSNSIEMYLGGRNDHSYVGLMDDVSVWSTALDPGEIAWLAGGAPATTVPEPASLIMVGLGALAAARAARRRQRA